MKRFVAIILSALMILCLCGCGTKTSQITTKNGQSFTAKGDVKYDRKSETYTFQNESGKKVTLNREDISVIKESK